MRPWDQSDAAVAEPVLHSVHLVRLEAAGSLLPGNKHGGVTAPTPPMSRRQQQQPGEERATHTHTDTCVHQLTSGEQVFDGVDCGGRGRLRSSQGPVGHQGLEHAHLLQGLMGNGGEERERGREIRGRE